MNFQTIDTRSTLLRTTVLIVGKPSSEIVEKVGFLDANFASTPRVKETKLDLKIHSDQKIASFSFLSFL